MVEAGLVIIGSRPIFWHLPKGRTGGSIPDSRQLWDIFWEYRKEEFLGFAHSHPGAGMPAPSWTDLTTFCAIETGLGRRLIWWITSSTSVIELVWEGPDKHAYRISVIEEPSWARALRNQSI